MDLQLIKFLAKDNKITIKDLSQKIGMSEQGLHRSIRTNSIAAEYLERIAKYFGVSVGVFYGEKDITPLKKLVSDAFKRDFDDVINYWVFIEQNEKILLQITEMDNSTVISKSIDEVRSELTATKRKEFDKTLQTIVNLSNSYINNIIKTVIDKPSMAFINNPADIKCLYDFGVINEELKAFIYRVLYNTPIEWNREPFVNSFRRYVLEHYNNSGIDEKAANRAATQMLLNS